MVTLEMEWGSNMDEITNDIRSYVDMVKDNLPDNCGTPVIFKLSTSSMPIAMYSVTADESYAGLDKLLIMPAFCPPHKAQVLGAATSDVGTSANL